MTDYIPIQPILWLERNGTHVCTDKTGRVLGSVRKMVYKQGYSVSIDLSLHTELDEAKNYVEQVLGARK